MGEAESVDQAEDEDEEEAEFAVSRPEDVFQGDDRDRGRDDGLDDVSRGGDVAQSGEGESNRMREREGRDLNQDRLPGTAEEEESEDEQDVVESFREDVFKALFKVTDESGPGAGIGRMRADATGGRAGRGFGGEAGQVEGEARFAREHDHETRVFLAVDGVGEDRRDLVAG